MTRIRDRLDPDLRSPSRQAMEEFVHQFLGDYGWIAMIALLLAALQVFFGMPLLRF